MREPDTRPGERHASGRHSASELPELDKEDIKAVRSFLPGKLLSRTAALLALVVLVLGFAGLADQGLKRFLDVDLSSTPWLHYALLFGLPLLAVASQSVVEWRAEHGRHTLQRLAVKAGVEQSGYFRIGPYLNSAEDRVKFDRADRTHEKVLSWIERSACMPLYLTGDSGSGKSSLLMPLFYRPCATMGGPLSRPALGRTPKRPCATHFGRFLTLGVRGGTKIGSCATCSPRRRAQPARTSFWSSTNSKSSDPGPTGTAAQIRHPHRGPQDGSDPGAELAAGAAQRLPDFAG